MDYYVTKLFSNTNAEKNDRSSLRRVYSRLQYFFLTARSWFVLLTLKSTHFFMKICAFVHETSARPVGMGLPRVAWVKLNRLRTGVGRFHSSMHKWGYAPSPNCECGASEQTADHVLTACSIHRAPHGARVLDDETRCWLNDTTASI